MLPKPSAPPLIDLVSNNEIAIADDDCNYNCEDGCDVEFLVGKDDEGLMRIPVHSQKLSEYPVFKAMLSDNFNVKYKFCDGGQRKLKQIRVEGIDSKAFDNMMKFVYKEPVNLQSVEMTVEILKAAHRFLLPGLVRACVKHLSKMISLANVLFIFANVRYLCNDLENLEELILQHMPVPQRQKHSTFTSIQNNNNVDKATTLSTAKYTAAANPSQDNHYSAGLEMKNACIWLLSQCLAFIDINAADVLKSDEIEELDRFYLKFLLERDSFDVSELAIFSALIRWAETECKRQQLPLTCNSKREILRELLYVVRYFQMPFSEFTSGPAKSNLLSPQEVDFIKNVLVHRDQPSANLSSRQANRNLSSSIDPNFNKQQIQNCEELQALKAHWKYLSQPRTPRLNNGITGDNDAANNDVNHSNTSDNNGKKRRRSSLGRASKKGLRKFKRIGFLVKNFIDPPPAHEENSIDKFSEVTDQQDQQHHVISINNDLYNYDKKDEPKKSVSSQQGNTSHDTLQRRESIISKAFDYSLRAFAFFFD